MAIVKILRDRHGRDFLLSKPIDMEPDNRTFDEALVEIMQKLGVLTPVEKEG